MCNVALSGHMPYGGGFLKWLAKWGLDLTSSMEIKRQQTRVQMAACVNWVRKIVLCKPQTKSLWKLIGRAAVLSITQPGQLGVIYLFGRKMLEGQSKIQINPCPITRNSHSWIFTVNPPFETLYRNFSSKTCIMKIFFYAPTLKLFILVSFLYFQS